MKLLAGNSNRALSEAIAAYLNVPLTKAVVRRFADMEVFVEIQENVRGEDAFVIQSTSYPANDHLMELLICIDALKRASARRITAVIPYFGYARQDRKPGPRTPISAKLVANLVTHAGADRVLTVDLHAGQIQGFFDIPTDNLFAAPVLTKDIQDNLNGKPLMVVSPDVGGVVRARAIAKRDTSQMRADTDHHQIGVMARNGAVLIPRCGLAGKIGIARIGVWQRGDRLFTRLGHLRLRPVADEDGFSAPIDGQLRAFCEPGDIHRDCRQGAHIRRGVHLVDERPCGCTCGNGARTGGCVIKKIAACACVIFCVGHEISPFLDQTLGLRPHSAISIPIGPVFSGLVSNRPARLHRIRATATT